MRQKEETGLVVDPVELKVAGTSSTALFVAPTWTGDPVNAEPRKHSQVTWFPVEQMPSEFVFTTGAALMNGGRWYPPTASSAMRLWKLLADQCGLAAASSRWAAAAAGHRIRLRCDDVNRAPGELTR
jgi:hypothetical protein